MRYVERIISRMLVHEAARNAFILYPVKIGSDLCELLSADAELEKDLVELYSRAAH